MLTLPACQRKRLANELSTGEIYEAVVALLVDEDSDEDVEEAAVEEAVLAASEEVLEPRLSVR